MPAEGFDLATVDKLLTTTRAVRRRLDLQRPVSLDVVMECLRLAIQAPTGTNYQTWRWLVITDPEIRRSIAELYRAPAPEAAARQPVSPSPDAQQQQRVSDSSNYLREHLQEVPVLLVPCVET